MKKALFILLAAVVLIACGRTSTNHRIEQIAEIQLPKNYTVVADDYQETGKNFYFQYELKFDHDSTMQLEQSIQLSKYYASDHVQMLYDSVWYKDGGLYKFEASDEQGTRKYGITFNPLSGVLNYIEYSSYARL